MKSGLTNVSAAPNLASSSSGGSGDGDSSDTPPDLFGDDGGEGGGQDGETDLEKFLGTALGAEGLVYWKVQIGISTVNQIHCMFGQAQQQLKKLNVLFMH